MTRSSALISVLFMVACTCCAQTTPTDSLGAEQDCVYKEYNVLIDARGRELTGICAVQIDQEGHAVGTIINEFGIKYLDFSFDGIKARVSNVFPPLNRWYIRRVLRNDLTIIWSNIRNTSEIEKNKRHLTFNPEGEIKLVNSRHKLTYIFQENKLTNETD